MDRIIYTELGREAISLALLMSTPIFLAALIIGLMVSIFQAVTSINDQTLTFVPKIVAIALMLIIFSSWLSDQLVGWAGNLFGHLANYIR